MKRYLYVLSILALVSCNKEEQNQPAPSVSVTPYNQLNSAGHTLNSHAGQTSNSTMTFIAGTYVKAGVNELNLEMPVYPRFFKTNDGRYLMFYHDGFYTASTQKSTWSGRNCYLAESEDMINWKFIKKLFPQQNNVQSVYGDRVINRSYSGSFPARMADGNIIVASAYMGNYDNRHRLLDNGLAVKISSDEGCSWTMEQRLNIGMNWEPCVLVLPEDSPHPGRVIIYYTDSCPYIDAGADAWKDNIISSGVSYVWSDDNGKTWQPQDLLDDHIHAYRYKRDENAKWKVYTDQMPGVIQLNGTHQLIGVSESNMAKCTSSATDYYIGISYGEKDGGWGTPDADGNMPREKKYDFKGCAPAVHQFTSGETIFTYNYNVDKDGNRFLLRIGDETGHNLGNEMRVFEDCSGAGYGFWGESLIDNHIVLMGIGGTGGTTGRNYYMQIGQYFLNHNIAASGYPVKVDGSNDEWKTSDEALYAGSGTKARATLRFSCNGGVLYGLAEVEASGAVNEDCINVYLSNPSADALSENDRWIMISSDSSIRSSYYNGKAWFADSDVNSYVVSKGDNCYIVEFGIPMSLVPAGNNAVKVNFSINDSVDGTQYIRSVTSKETSNWMKLMLK